MQSGGSDEEAEGRGGLAATVDAHAGLDVARLAHELRTPLGAIKALAEIIRDERLGSLGSPRYRGYAADIHDSAAHATAVLAAYLDPVGRGASGPMEHVEIDLEQLLAGAISALGPLADKASVALLVRLQASMPRVIADRRSVRQMVDNLVVNALRFTPPGGEVVVSLDYRAGGPVVIEVADNGDGMTAAELERARTGVVRSGRPGGRSGGSGLGLPLVRALAAANGAVLELDSAPGKGARARLAFAHDRVVPV